MSAAILVDEILVRGHLRDSLFHGRAEFFQILLQRFLIHDIGGGMVSAWNDPLTHHHLCPRIDSEQIVRIHVRLTIVPKKLDAVSN
jgi:hypothetical protein